MHPGRASIEMSRLGILTALLRGGSESHFLYFRPQENRSPTGCIESLNQAFRCLRCLTLVIAGEELAGGPRPGPDDEVAARKAIADIDGLLARGQSPAAARLYRDITGVTWDKAHDTLGRWNTLPLEHRMAILAGGISKQRGRSTRAAPK
jgi:hypothetical protein